MIAISRWTDKARDALVTGLAAFTLFELLRPQPSDEDAERATWALAARPSAAPRPAEVARPPSSWWASASEPEREAMRAALRAALGRAGDGGRQHALNARIRTERASLGLHRRELAVVLERLPPDDARERLEVWHRYQVLRHEARLQHLRALANRARGEGRGGGSPSRGPKNKRETHENGLV